jgi:hypothetical protein
MIGGRGAFGDSADMASSTVRRMDVRRREDVYPQDVIDALKATRSADSARLTGDRSCHSAMTGECCFEVAEVPDAGGAPAEAGVPGNWCTRKCQPPLA